MRSRGRHCTLHRILQICAVGAMVCSLLGCYASNNQTLLDNTTAQRDPVAAIRSADLGAQFPAATDPQVNNSRQSSQPLLFPGSAIEPAPSPSGPTAPTADFRLASADPAAIVMGDGVQLNFEGADIQSVAKTVLGDTLGINFVVDPRVQGNVTLASTGPIPRKHVLAVFESVLRMSNAAIVHEGKCGEDRPGC